VLAPSYSPTQALLLQTMMQANRGQNDIFAARRVLKRMLKKHGPFRLWRGMPITMTACIPAHAAYFSVYEAMKTALRVDDPGHYPVQAAICGGSATMLHDVIMTPMDVVKQRLQLGYYGGIVDCVKRIAVEEGVAGFLRSYPTTLMMNVPYVLLCKVTSSTPAHDTFCVVGGIRVVNQVCCHSGRHQRKPEGVVESRRTA